MNSLLKSVKAATSKKDTLIKKSLIVQLSNSVKEIQLYTVEESATIDTIQMNEALGNLCSVIEAVLLHGLKDSLVYRARRAIADFDQKPEPSFWAPLLIISHRQIIDQVFSTLKVATHNPTPQSDFVGCDEIQSAQTGLSAAVQYCWSAHFDTAKITNLSQIVTEIGQCRAWIRLALNDCLLSSYISSMRQDPSVIKPYYNTSAFVRDTELLEVAQKLIEGVETLSNFTLPSNSSLLNNWQLDSLVLAGIWSPTLRACPVASAVDVAQGLTTTSTETNSDTVSLSSAISFTSHNSGIGGLLALNEDEALKIILAKHTAEQNVNTKPLQLVEENERLNGDKEEDKDDASAETSSIQPESNLGNSLSKRSGWSFSQVQETTEPIEIIPNASQEVVNTNLNNPKLMETSYNALIESYNLLGGTYIKTPDLKEVWHHLEKKNREEPVLSESENITTSEVSNDIECKLEPLPMVTHIGKISRERGLSSQNYICAGCQEPLSLTPKPKVCGFTSEYFCDNCMSSECIQIPARIIHNWDFKTYQISQKSLNYVNEIKNLPTVDFKLLNPLIYSISDDMANLQSMRIQLNFLRDYLFTCREPVIEELQQQINGKNYMYEHVDQYSISDISEIRNGVLIQHLQKVVKFGKEHVQNCWLCSQKGFICEVCNKPKILYPFEVENVFRCNICNAVYHNGCLNSTRPCPKCKRIKEREDLPLLGATMK